MPALQPVNLSVGDVHLAAGLGAEVRLPARPKEEELANWTQEAYSLDVSEATNLGFPLGNLSSGHKRQALMFGISRWKDVTKNERIYRFGVALRAIVVVSEIQGAAALTLPVVAAKVEIEGARATAQLLVRGYKGQLAEALPAWQSFGVDSYAEYMKAVSNIQRIILGDKPNVEPELLATSALSRTRPSPGVSVGHVYGLHAISEGSSLGKAIEKLPNKGDNEVIDTVQDVYKAYGVPDHQAAPTTEQRADAERELRGLHLSHGWFH